MLRRNKGTSKSMKNSHRHAKYYCSEDEAESDHSFIPPHDTEVRYFEEDPNLAEVARNRKPRRHTTTGGPQHNEAIEHAKHMLGDDSHPTSQYSTLDRKQLVAMLKQRYGPEMEKYKTGDKSQQQPTRVNGSARSPTTQRSTLQVPGASPKCQNQNQQPRTITTTTTTYNKSRQQQQPTLNRQGVRKESHSSYESSNENIASPHFQKRQLPNENLKDFAMQQYNQRQRYPSSSSSYVQNGHQSSDGVVHEADQWNRPERVVYLQYKDEIKRVNMPKSISSIDTVKALFVTSFPGKLTMARMDDRQNVYIKDKAANIFYELEDIREVQPRTHLKVHEKSNSYDSFGSSRQGMDDTDFMQTSSSTYESSTIQGFDMRRQQHSNYAESLQDFEVQPRLYRSVSGSSLRSDSALTRPGRKSTRAEPIMDSVTSITPTRSRPEPSDPYVHHSQSKPPSTDSFAVTSQNRLHEAPKQQVVRQPQNSTVTMNQGWVKTEETVKNELFAPKVPPKVKQKPQVDAHKSNTTVEEQLADLTELLHTALAADERDERDGEDTDDTKDSRPGKLNQELLDNLELLAEDNFSKSTTKGCSYRPIDLIVATKQTKNSHETLENVNDFSVSKDIFSHERSANYQSDKCKNPDNFQTDSQEMSRDYLSDNDESLNKTHESSLASLLLRDLKGRNEAEQSPVATNPSNTIHTTVTISSTGSISTKDSLSPRETRSHATPPPVAPKRQASSRIAVANVSAAESHVAASIVPVLPQSPDTEYELYTARSTAMTHSPSARTFDKRIEMASTAAGLRANILSLRMQVDELRLLQHENIRNFKSFIHKCNQDFNLLSDRVNNNVVPTTCNNSLRTRRQRADQDEDAYNKKVDATDRRLRELEDEVEFLRRDVVQRKRVMNGSNLERLNFDLESLGRNMAELKSRFSGLHDMLKVVMSGELEVVVQEEKFLRDEPSRLDNLFARCKHLSGTIFTLQKLASVQQLTNKNDTPEHSVNGSHPRKENASNRTDNQIRFQSRH